jgi:quercetin 2,3-dioxygenase
MTVRSVRLTHKAHRQLEGGGFEVRRPFPSPGLPDLDPFLLLDEMGPKDWLPGKAIGAPDHPHRGFETVTYVLDGAFEHKDSHGNQGVLGPGDVQWMTAGGGVVHSEMPTEEFRREGGRMHGFQLWVNLPSHDKMMKPRYQDLPTDRIPTASSPDGLARVRVVAGMALGVDSLIATRIPIVYQHWTLEPGADITQRIEPGQTAFAYVFSGDASFGPEGQEKAAAEGRVVVFEDDGASVRMVGPRRGSAELLLLAGQPIGEPIAWHGPFVMNSQDEIVRAFQDFQAGRFGEIPPDLG